MKNLKFPLLMLIGSLLILYFVLLPRKVSNLPSEAQNTGLNLSQNKRSHTPKEAATESTVNPEIKTQISKAYAKLQMQFEENVGQTASEAKYIARGRGYSLFLTSSEAVLAVSEHPKAPISKDERHPANQAGVDSLKTAVIRMEPIGGNRSAVITGVDELPGKSNYFIGNDPRKWRTDVTNFGKVKYESVYPGVDLIYYGNQRQLEYDFVVAPRGNPDSIRLRFKGTKGLTIGDDGALVIKTPVGTELRHSKPVIYQEIGGRRIEVAGNYVLRNREEVSFNVAPYDRTKTLVIDPTLVYSTYLGGGSDDQAFGVAVDSTGNAYVTGRTTSTNFPTLNSIASADNVFVTKLNPSGTALVYSTYLGGSGFNSELGTAIDVDSSGNAYFTGETSSNDFPRVNPAQPEYGGFVDAFVAKLNPSGNALVYSTYLGGTLADIANGIKVFSGEAYVAGWTFSTNFPTIGAQQAVNAGSSDAFITKLNADGSLLSFSTYLGGSGEERCYAMAVDGLGNGYVTGYTMSTNFPILGGVQSANQGGTIGQDVFITKVNSVGQRVYSTYLGGNVDDTGYAIAVDGLSQAYIAGSAGGTFPTTAGAHKTVAGGGDAFVSKLNATGGALVFSTFLGGTDREYADAIAVGSGQQVYVAGRTDSANFPMVNPLQSILAEDPGAEGFLTRINSAGNTLDFSTYLGGTGVDYITALATNANGVYFVGTTAATDFPITPGVFQVNSLATNSLSQDAFVGRITETVNQSFRSVRGTFRNSNLAPLPGAAVTLGGRTVISNPNGNYVFHLLTPGAGYSLLPESSIPTVEGGYIFLALNSNQIDKDFTAAQPIVKIGGKITNKNGRGLAGITVNLSDGSTQTKQTDGNGNYFFNVIAGRNYRVTPSDPRVNVSGGWLPVDFYSHTNLTQDALNDNFEARTPVFTVAGTIRFFGGGTVNNRANAVTLSGAASASYPTNGNGAYTSDQLNTLADYTFTPQPFTVGGINYNVFSPPSTSFVSIDSNYLTVDFTAIPQPAATTAAATSITATSATLNGNANPNGIATSAWFEWGTDPTLTTNIATSSQSIGSGTASQPITANLASLSGSTTYYFRAVAMSNGGTARGSILNFTTAPTPRTLTVASTNPASGVSITVSPNDNSGAGNGTTEFTRTYNNNQSVSLTAPTTASGNNFQKWLKDGADFANNTLTNVSVTMDANHTMTAVYVTPGPTIFVEDGTTQLAAVDSITFVRGPFTLSNPKNFSSDQRTRIIFFTTNLGLPQTSQPPTNTLSVQVGGNSHAVESVGPNAATGGSFIVFRLPDLSAVTHPLGIRLNGVNSANTPTLTIIASPSSPAVAPKSKAANLAEYLLFPLIDFIF